MPDRDQISTAPVRSFHEVPGGVIAQLAGEINLENAPEMREGLMVLADQKHPERMILDLREVPYMDSSAIAVLVEVLRKVRAWNGKLILFGLQQRVRGLIEIARLNNVFWVAETEAAAVQA
jgi:anti-sigma B factor antagonist